MGTSHEGESEPPRLPFELEHIIFVLAFEGDRKDAKHLLLVAKRVFDWLIPHVFNVVQIYLDRTMPISFNETVYKRYGHHTRHLHLEPEAMVRHLPLFPNVINLTLWVPFDSAYKPFLLDLPLTRLTIMLSGYQPPPPELFQVFSRLTYLDLVTILLSWSSHRAIVEEHLYLPNLTHLCIVDSFAASILHLFLDKRRCPELRLVILRGSPSRTTVNDQRVLIMKPPPTRNWDEGARGGIDMWKVAEQAISSRSDGDDE
ncbi:hypothetical protein BDN72DRAFT_958589 [Pluteus cervinus]|uniref:Uncharacterized protein n=1 Tax=Pluteus cervinus TaxID=181527 RepID=A0ACD3B0I3_9AGAR|nr:hypothetical protein BDN72DRAFT_958589 [Pluteus cervinus]